VDEHARDSHEASVTEVRFSGREAIVRLDMGNAPGVQVRASVPGYRAPCVNDKLHICVDGKALAYAQL
jgi:hypothetical protein